MKNKVFKRRTETRAFKLFSHPVVRILCDPKVRQYLKESERKSLAFGDLQYLLCKEKPKKKKWHEHWNKYFPLENGLTKKEVYKSKEHLYQEITRLRRRYPGIIQRIDGTYALFPNVRSSAMKEHILSRLDNHTHILIIGENMYFGLDSNSFDEEDSEFFDTFVHKPLMELANQKEMVKFLWLQIHLKTFLKEFKQIYDDVAEKDRGHFIGYVYDHLKWFLRASNANPREFQEFFQKLKEYVTTRDPESWKEAEEYLRNMSQIFSKQGKEIRKHVQDEIRGSSIKESHFNIVTRALEKMVKGSITSKKEYEWLKVQQQMSKLYSKKLKDSLTSRTLDEMPLIVIDTS